MKLADAPLTVRAALDLQRWSPFFKQYAHPDNGDLWWSAESHRCAVCGAPNPEVRQDHCHVTGLIRGQLCTGCNLAEGRDGGAIWPYWRALAPGLAFGCRTFHHDRFTSSALSWEQTMTLSMADLYVRHAASDDVNDRLLHPHPVYDVEADKVVFPFLVARKVTAPVSSSIRIARAELDRWAARRPL